LINYEIHQEADLIVFAPTESFSSSESVETWQDIFANPLFRKGMRTLLIAAPGTLDRIDRQTVFTHRDYILKVIEQRGTGEAAMVAPADLEYGMLKMVQIFSEGAAPFDVRVFRSLDEALTWLGVSAGSVAR